jgi:glycosylphosphatidylinositol transamidase (GPIT) subunit GPI8
VNNDFRPSPEKMIDKNYSNDEIHRAFFKAVIGKHFKFNVQFMNWMEENKGKKSYKEAIEAYNKILLDKKTGNKTIIGKQFEYNQYTRDFFENNPELKKEDCIKCWKYKKKQTGNHKYEKDDLKILKE